jgi:hypothetical protein
VPVLVPTLREIRALYGLRAGILQSRPVTDVSAQEATFGIHAGEVETSWILAAAGHLVDPSKSVCEYPARTGDPGEVRLSPRRRLSRGSPAMSPSRGSWTTPRPQPPKSAGSAGNRRGRARRSVRAG